VEAVKKILKFKIGYFSEIRIADSDRFNSRYVYNIIYQNNSQASDVLQSRAINEEQWCPEWNNKVKLELINKLTNDIESYFDEYMTYSDFTSIGLIFKRHMICRMPLAYYTLKDPL